MPLPRIKLGYFDYQSNILSLNYRGINLFGATEGTRTPTPYGTNTSSLRGYQLRHSRIFYHTAGMICASQYLLLCFRSAFYSHNAEPKKMQSSLFTCNLVPSVGVEPTQTLNFKSSGFTNLP